MSQNPFHAAPGGQPDVIMDIEVAEPKMYQVLLHNDDYTTMEFVVNILMTVFHKTAVRPRTSCWPCTSAEKALLGIYPHEIAETKVDKTHFLAREAGYPLRCTLEEVGA